MVRRTRHASVAHGLLLALTLGLTLITALPSAEARWGAEWEQQHEIALVFPFVPDPALTKGSLCTEIDPDFERLRYDERIPFCKRNVSKSQRNRIYDTYGVPERCRKEFTIDHFVPLSIGGSNRPDNLWPEHKAIKNLRSDLEETVYKKVLAGDLTQAQAIRIINEAKWKPDVRDPGDFEWCR